MIRDIHCTGCGACVNACPQDAISMDEMNKRIINRGKCNSCLVCVDSCLYHSLNRCGQYMTVGDVLHEVMQDRLFYKNSNGGVTISGGEPLVQSSFVSRLLAECKKENLHTALETAGHGSWKTMEMLLGFVDLLLFDIKHLESGEHQKLTGVKNDILLKNLQKAAAIKPVWLRVPLIAGVNDSETHIRAIAALAKKIDAQKISLLPYHEGGKSKCEQLGVIYQCDKGKAPAEKQIMRLQDIIEKAGMAVSVGN